MIEPRPVLGLLAVAVVYGALVAAAATGWAVLVQDEPLAEGVRTGLWFGCALAVVDSAYAVCLSHPPVGSGRAAAPPARGPLLDGVQRRPHEDRRRCAVAGSAHPEREPSLRVVEPVSAHR